MTWEIKGLRRYDVEVVERLPLPISLNPSNARYLRAKREKIGDLLPWQDGAAEKDSLWQ